MKAIVVDDSRNIVNVLSVILENLDIHVVGKGDDGNAAVKLYKLTNPDIVFLDVLMPIADGFFALREIRKINPNAVIVFVTADPLIEHKLLESSVVPTGVIQKPFDLSKIANVVSSISDSLPYNDIIDFQKNLIRISIERTLMGLGSDEYEMVRQKLKSEYKFGFEDCLEHPKILKKVLCDFFASSYKELVEKIIVALSGFLLHAPIDSFISEITANSS